MKLTRHHQGLPLYERGDFEHPSGERDMVMKGGITFGVVYLYAVLQIAPMSTVSGTSVKLLHDFD